ncbi:lysophospholipid acyltransferase family protein [Bacteriovorax sp. Seq25_V]|uniref:lysophospholipid acyltransferase family protein n=1 Tax=Bacteriovorax sp. Seq25_V TaxID=1201288 RepID=UPI00038A41F4|nr:lysophospholipid acyltransferase family protein [Bacteriovorax sp. Seq25_V]EQC47218.1 PF04028 domain protein [Bacteriovorax sp. Seq25_V]
MIANLIYILVSVFKLLSRKKYHNIEFREQAKKLSPHGNYIMAVWHNNLVSCILNAETPMVSMTSLSKDGTIASDTARKFNIYTARGSSSRGGKEALMDMVKHINETHHHAGLTVDGPRGPVHEPKPGIFKIAQLTGCPILPYCVISTRRKEFRSWDKLRLPLPFGTMHILYGEPYFITEEVTKENLDAHIKTLRDKLMDLENQFTKLM